MEFLKSTMRKAFFRKKSAFNLKIEEEEETGEFCYIFL